MNRVIDHLTCDLLILHGEEDCIVEPEATQKTYSGAREPKEVRM